MGRPKSENPKKEFIGFRLLPSQRKAIENRARAKGMTISEFIISVLMKTTEEER